MFTYYYFEETKRLIRISSTNYSIIQFQSDGRYGIDTYEGKFKDDLTSYKIIEHDEFIKLIKAKYKHDISLEILLLEERILEKKRLLLNIENNNFNNI